MSYLGYIEVNVKIQDAVYTNVGVVVECATGSSQSIQAVLGCNVLGSVSKQSKETPSLLNHDSAWSNVMSVLDLNEETKQIGFVKLTGRQPVKIPANTMEVVQGSTRQN